MHEQYLSHFTMIIMCMTCHHKCRSIYKEDVTETIIFATKYVHVS